MDSKQTNNFQSGRERAVYDYLESLENGDLDGIIDVLLHAAYDASLDQLIVDAHEAYFRDEGLQNAALVDQETHEMPVPELATMPAYEMEQRHKSKAKRMSRWVPVLAAVLILAVLLSSVLTLFALNNAKNGGIDVPPVIPACRPYSLKQFDAQNRVTTAVSLNILAAVTAVSANDAWAVGASYSPVNLSRMSTFIEHWDGKSWSMVPSPNSADGNGSLLAVAAVSANDVWAVGSYTHGADTPGTGDSASRMLIEHWDGKSWKVVPIQNGVSSLSALTVVSANNIWAVGYFYDATLQLDRPLLEHWNGADWKPVPFQGTNGASGTPLVTMGFLSSVAAVSANDIWAVGMGRNANEQNFHALTIHWNGSRWTLEPSLPNSRELRRVSALSSHDLWGAGNDSKGYPLITHWDGQQWRKTALPASLTRPNVLLNGLTVVSANDIWVVGDVLVSDLTHQLLIFHWNGETWRQVPVPAQQGFNNLPSMFANDIVVYGQRQIWIVGNTADTMEGTGRQSLILGQLTCP